MYTKYLNLRNNLTNDEIENIKVLCGINQIMCFNDVEISCKDSQVILVGENTYKLQRTLDDMENCLERKGYLKSKRY